MSVNYPYPGDYTGVLRRSTPSLPTLSQAYLSNTAIPRIVDHGQVRREIEEYRRRTPQMDVRPLVVKNTRQQNDSKETITQDNINTPSSSTRSRCPPTPKRKSSHGATLKRSYTVDGRKSPAYIAFDGTSDELPAPNKGSVSRRGSTMAWLQGPEKRDTNARSSGTQNTHTIPITADEKKETQNRAFTEPTKRVAGDTAASRFNSDMKRALSSGSRLKKAFTFGSNSPPSDEFLAKEGEEAKKKRKSRVFSKDFFRTESKASRAERHSILPPGPPIPIQPLFVARPPSLKSGSSNHTVITRRSIRSHGSSDTDAGQASSSTGSFQMDGIASTGDERSTGKIFNDSVIGIIDGKVGIMLKSKSGYQWKPPLLTLNLQVICPFDRLPVRVRKGMELWVAVILQGHVVGDIDWPGAVGNAAGIGLDVGVLLDISSFTSPDSFVQMKAEAKRLVEAMETSRDRVVAMTFSSPHLGKRRASMRGRPHLKVINSTGSVSKKQLLDDLSALELGLVTDPNSRDVTAAINAAVKELRNMPPDNGRYGLKRSGHLFLLTTRLQSGEIQGNFKGTKVHVLGIGPIFNPSSAAGGDGWCAATSSPLDPVSQLQKIVADGVEVPVESPPKTNDVKSIVNILRMGLDLGVIQGGDLFLHPGQGCKIKAVLGDAAFPILRPGERKSLMVKIEVSDLPGFKSGDSTIKNVERQLKATLGELTSTILNAEAVYCHSHLSTPATTITTKAQAEVVRFVEGCIWSRSSQDINGDIPDFLVHDEKLQSAKATTDSVLVQVLANRHSSARDARNAIEQLKDVDAPAVLRELGYQVYLEDRYGTRTVAENSTAESFTEPMMEAFERRLSPGNRDTDRMLRPIANPTAKTAARKFDEESSDLLMDGSPGPGSEHRSDQSSSSRFEKGRPDRHQTPDEARRLWMRLEGYDEDDLGALNMSDDEFDEFDDRNLYYGDDRSNHGEDTIVTYRNVRETDFSPWAV